MKVFAIGDLHLSFCRPFTAGAVEPGDRYKPMDVFGAHWQGHEQKIYDNWQQLVAPEDAVLVPGDLSWGMNLEDCRHDWDFLSQLPGRMYICRGNHDYWWQGIGKVRQSLPPNVIPLNHNSAVVGGRAVCATRGWILPGSGEWHEKDEKIYRRELLRLEMALEEGRKSGLPLAVMMHYMPCHKTGEPSDFIELMQGYQIELCIYGHLHGEDCRKAVEGESFGFQLLNVSGDCLNFRPRFLWEGDS